MVEYLTGAVFSFIALFLVANTLAYLGQFVPALPSAKPKIVCVVEHFKGAVFTLNAKRLK